MRTFLSLFALALAFTPAHGQIFPLSENRWDNPEFRQRFLGSFGVNTRIEPELSRDEATLFGELVDLIGTNPDQAIARLRAALTAESSAALDYTLASLLLQQGDLPAAVRNYRNAIRKFPNFMRAYRNLGLALVQQGEFADAIPMLVKAIELGDGDGNTFGLLGFSYLNVDRPRSALDAYRTAYMLRPDSRDWKIGLAQALTMNGDHAQASAILREMIEANPAQTSLWLTRVNSLISLGQEMEAAAHLEVLSRMEAANAASLRLLGDIYLNAAMPQLAVANYSRAMRVDGGLPIGQALGAARNLLTFAAFDEAAEFVQLLEQKFQGELDDSQHVALLNLVAEIALARGADSEAAATLERVLQTDPLNGRALLLLGNYYNRSGNVEEAEFFYRRAATIESVQVDALIQHARMLVSTRNFAGAVPLLERAQSIRPNSNVEAYLTAVRSARDAAR